VRPGRSFVAYGAAGRSVFQSFLHIARSHFLGWNVILEIHVLVVELPDGFVWIFNQTIDMIVVYLVELDSECVFT